MGRQDTGSGRPFPFILNHSRATATSVFLMLYPKPALAKVLLDRPELLKEVWQALAPMDDEVLIGEGRVYGRAVSFSNFTTSLTHIQSGVQPIIPAYKAKIIKNTCFACYERLWKDE